MPLVNVKEDQVHEKNVNGKNGPYINRSQRASLSLGEGYELPFRVGLGSGPVYPVGSYDIDAESFSLNQYGDLILNRIKLKPVRTTAAAAAQAPK